MQALIWTHFGEIEEKKKKLTHTRERNKRRTYLNIQLNKLHPVVALTHSKPWLGISDHFPMCLFCIWKYFLNKNMKKNSENWSILFFEQFSNAFVLRNIRTVKKDQIKTGKTEKD